jgi:hypothetical protein
MKEMIIAQLKYTPYLSKYSPRPLVAPTTGRGYSSTTNRELNQHGFGIKLKKRSLAKISGNVLSYIAK